MSQSVEAVIASRDKDLGGLVVRRVLPAVRRRSVGPFVFLDHFGPRVVDAEHGMSVRPHPHIGLATVSYLFEGEILHRDSLGFEQPITPGAINWMTAGRGIVHSERMRPEFQAEGGRLHGVQVWLALPLDKEEMEPAFEHHPANSFAEKKFDRAAARVLFGSAYGLASQVTMHSPTLYVDLRFEAGGALVLEAAATERAVYVTEGALEIEGTTYEVGKLVLLREGAAPVASASASARAVLLGGAPLDGPRHMYWNFVSSRPERIEEAKRAWSAGEFPRVPGDETEFIPLPEE